MLNARHEEMEKRAGANNGLAWSTKWVVRKQLAMQV